MADRCLQRPDCTSVTIRRETDFTTTTKSPSQLHVHREGHVVNASLCFGKNTGLPCLHLWPRLYPDGLGVSHQGPRPSRSCVGQLYHPSHPFPPTTRLSMDRFPDCLSFTATGFLSARRLEQAALELPATRRRSCQSCYFRGRGEERENVYDVCERERFRVSCPHHSTLEDSSPVMALNINMSSQSYKHMVKENT